jgi:hypothetical protein
VDAADNRRAYQRMRQRLRNLLVSIDELARAQ